MTKGPALITNPLRWRIIIAAASCIAAVAAGQAVQNAASHCMPTCEIDGRFLAVTGNDPTTLSASQIAIGLAFPVAGGPSTGGVDLFDGDRDSTRWDVKNLAANAEPPQLELELYADPSGTGTGGTLVKKWAAGEINFTNSEWTGVTWPHAAGALSAAGPDQAHRYTLKIIASNPGVDVGWNVFKLRSAAAIQIPPQVIAFIGSLVLPGDGLTIYPKYPNLTTTAYDGSWSFKFRVPAGAEQITVFDGDMDYGDAACAINDTDDRDSTGVPKFDPGAVAEGVATAGTPCTGGTGTRTGRPPEDNAGQAFRRSPTQSPDTKGIVYRVIAPDGQVFLNRNPSGNREWEQFKIVKVAAAGSAPCPAAGFATHDCQTTSLPEGLWEVQIDGMDLTNLNFLYLNFKIER